MHEQDEAILKALVPVAWADGQFSEKEHEMLEALLDAYQATEAEKSALRAYASEPKTLDTIPLQDLSSGDRRVLLHHAVLLSFADGNQDPSEVAMLDGLAAKLRVPKDEAQAVMDAAASRAKTLAHLL